VVAISAAIASPIRGSSSKTPRSSSFVEPLVEEARARRQLLRRRHGSEEQAHRDERAGA
jgi:hypothetical protein